jgi:hypothetical protein
MHLMLQFHHAGAKPSLEQVRELFGLDAGDVDEEYGVVTTDPNAPTYVVLIRREAADKAQARLQERPPNPREGVFGNPRIEPMAPESG